MAQSYQRFTLHELAVAALDYLSIQSDADSIATSGNSYDLYVRAKTWANLALEAFAAHGDWPFLKVAFADVTIAADAYQADLPLDSVKLSTDVSYEDYAVIFNPVSLQQLQQLRASSTTTSSYPYTMALGYSTQETAWIAATEYAIGDYIQPTTGENGFRYICSAVAGDELSGAVEPTWSVVIDVDTDDDTNVTWTTKDAGRNVLFVWPTLDTARTLKVAYIRRIPEMVNITDYPLIPIQYHRIIRDGTMAMGVKYHERNAGGDMMQTFVAATADAFLKAIPSNMAQGQLRSHLGRSGSRDDYTRYCNDVVATHPLY